MSQNLSVSYKDKTDQALVRLVKSKGDNDAFKEICSRYENVFYKICQKYAPTLTISGVNPQDIFDEKDYIVFHCVKTYKGSKNTKLSTWIGNYARYLCLNTINSRKFILPTATEELHRRIEETQQVTNFFQEGFAKEDFKYVSNILEQLKDQRIRDIIYLRYFADNKKMIWTKIARKMNISTQTAINLHNKGLDLLRNKLKSQNISDVV